MELKDLTVPKFYWRYYSTSGLYELPHLVKKSKKFVWADFVYYLHPQRNVEAVYLTQLDRGLVKELLHYQQIHELPSEVKELFIKTIFRAVQIKKI